MRAPRNPSCKKGRFDNPGFEKVRREKGCEKEGARLKPREVPEAENIPLETWPPDALKPPCPLAACPPPCCAHRGSTRQMANAAMGTRRRILSYYKPTSPEKLPLFIGPHNLYALRSLARRIGPVQLPMFAPGRPPARPLRYDGS